MKGVIGKNPRDLDQFFTKESVAVKCIKHLEKIISCNLNSFNCIVEPSFGEGAFVKAILKIVKSKDRLIYVDIDASDKKHRYDFLKDDYVIKSVKKMQHVKDRVSDVDGSESGGCLTIGNPPFGKNSSLAIEFFNRAAEFSDIIAFIIPRTFCKQSVKNKLNRSFFLIEEFNLNNDGEETTGNNTGSFTFKGKSYNVPCVFQIWSNKSVYIKDEHLNENMFKTSRPLYPKFSKTKHFIFVSNTNSNVNLAIRRVGVNAGRIFEKDAEKCSKQSHLFLSFTHDNPDQVIENLKALDLENVQFKYDTAGCPSISKSELCSIYTEKYLSTPGK